MIIAGLGCRRDCPASDIVALVRLAEQRAGCRVTGLAAPAFKHAETALRDAAAQLALPLVYVEDSALTDAQSRCVTRSERVRRTCGFASVAEAAALAASDGPLLMPRIEGARATCALAGQ